MAVWYPPTSAFPNAPIPDTATHGGSYLAENDAQQLAQAALTTAVLAPAPHLEAQGSDLAEKNGEQPAHVALATKPLTPHAEAQGIPVEPDGRQTAQVAGASARKKQTFGHYLSAGLHQRQARHLLRYKMHTEIREGLYIDKAMIANERTHVRQQAQAYSYIQTGRNATADCLAPAAGRGEEGLRGEKAASEATPYGQEMDALFKHGSNRQFLADGVSGKSDVLGGYLVFLTKDMASVVSWYRKSVKADAIPWRQDLSTGLSPRQETEQYSQTHLKQSPDE
ncbi:hypothetical protein FA95DRAFT_1578847 [Auriscalpium vulgare]|uniref:Uncharacterized protein n=1 Tax=Auriscalpium vulgare TaxID=40419 RepID=A0ACB8R0P9_9AGAM|nr:hypothetical protein FA95DRAFT_1578847 [Auriscalpium vulgare]